MLIQCNLIKLFNFFALLKPTKQLSPPNRAWTHESGVWPRRPLSPAPYTEIRPKVRIDTIEAVIRTILITITTVEVEAGVVPDRRVTVRPRAPCLAPFSPKKNAIGTRANTFRFV